MTTTDNRAAIIWAVPEETPSLVTTQQAARALNISTRTLHRWITAGIVKPSSRTAGGHFRWDVDDLRRQVERHLSHGQD